MAAAQGGSGCPSRAEQPRRAFGRGHGTVIIGKHAQVLQGLHAPVVAPDLKMEVRTCRSSSATDVCYFLALDDAFARNHVEPLGVAIHSLVSSPVIDDDAVAVRATGSRCRNKPGARCNDGDPKVLREVDPAVKGPPPRVKAEVACDCGIGHRVAKHGAPRRRCRLGSRTGLGWGGRQTRKGAGQGHGAARSPVPRRRRLEHRAHE